LGWSGGVTAIKDGYIFNPLERMYNDVRADQADQDYNGRPGYLLSEGLDTGLIFTTGGAAPWQRVSESGAYEGDAAQSGAMTEAGDSWIQTTVPSDGLISFQWKTSGQYSYDYLDFYIDGGLVSGQITGQPNWLQVSNWGVNGAGPHTLRWVYKQRSPQSTSGWLDQVSFELYPWNPDISGYVLTPGGEVIDGVTLTFSDGGGSTTTDGTGYYTRRVPTGWSGTVTLSRTGFSFAPQSRTYSNLTGDVSAQDYTGTGPSPLQEALDTSLEISTGGNAAWYKDIWTTHDGTDAAVSPTISDAEEAWMETTVSGAGTVSFWWKVSSEAYCDWLRFSIDGTQADEISGEADWQQTVFEIYGTGSHTLRWRYVKDSSSLDGSDCGWVDCLTWTPSP